MADEPTRALVPVASGGDRSGPARLGPGLVAFGLLAAAGLLVLGWYLGTLATTERTEAVLDEFTRAGDRGADDFDRPDGPLVGSGTADGGLAWSVLGPVPEIIEGGLHDTGDQPSLVLTTVAPDLTTGLVLHRPAPGVGLVFRFVDLGNHWTLVAAPEFSTWNLVLTVDGAVRSSTPLGLTATGAGTRVSVSAVGPEIRIFVDGVPVLEVVDPSHERADAVGIVLPGGTDGVVDDFIAVPSDPAPTG